jgi:hypothetical protein
MCTVRGTVFHWQELGSREIQIILVIMIARTAGETTGASSLWSVSGDPHRMRITRRPRQKAWFRSKEGAFANTDA